MTPILTLSFSNPKILKFYVSNFGYIQPLEYSILLENKIDCTVFEYNISYDEMNDKMKNLYSEDIDIFINGEGDVKPLINEFKTTIIKVILNNVTVFFRNYGDYEEVILS